ncbi:regulatory protein RecX [Tsuneonella sp. HG222]
MPKPIDPQRFEELALAYVARFSSSAAKFERYLRRKLHERGWDGEGEPPVEATVARYVELGYIDDESYARMKSTSLLRRGYGGRRVSQALGEAGIAEDLRAAVAPGEHAARTAALTYARKRRFGPFGLEAPERDVAEKQIGAMVRAGHGFAAARTLVEAADEAEAMDWVAEASDEMEP